MMRTAAASYRRGLASVVIGFVVGVGVLGAGRVQPSATLAQPAPRSGFALGPPVEVADGVSLFRPEAASLLDPPGPLAVQALRVDRSRVRLAIALADASTPARQPLPVIARQLGALAAVNASFFDMATGRQVGLLKVDGEAVAVSARTRGALAWSDTEMLFNRVAVGLAVRLGGRGRTIAVDHVNPVESRSGLSLYTSAYRLAIPGRQPLPVSGGGADVTDAPEAASPARARTAWASVCRWRLVASTADPKVRPTVTAAVALGETVEPTVRLTTGSRWRVAAILRDAVEPLSPAGDGSPVLAYRSRTRSVPRALRGLSTGSPVEIVETYRTAEGTRASGWEQATYAVGGAGLLVRDGVALDDWREEALHGGFVTERHPRTLIGIDADGDVWLVTVDGRRPGVSVGMSFAELQRLAAALGLVSALNLDGGGSTTMVVGGEVMNRPSDLAGSRPVPDAIVVLPRRRER